MSSSGSADIEEQQAASKMAAKVHPESESEDSTCEQGFQEQDKGIPVEIAKMYYIPGYNTEIKDESSSSGSEDTEEQQHASKMGAKVHRQESEADNSYCKQGFQEEGKNILEKVGRMYCIPGYNTEIKYESSFPLHEDTEKQQSAQNMGAITDPFESGKSTYEQGFQEHNKVIPVEIEKLIYIPGYNIEIEGESSSSGSEDTEEQQKATHMGAKAHQLASDSKDTTYKNGFPKLAKMAGHATQERTILAWVHRQLPDTKGEITLERFQDGVLLRKLVSAVGDNITGCVDKPENKKQKERNVDAALKFLKIVGVDISGIKCKDILNGSDKILPLLKSIFFYTLTKLLRAKGVSRARGETDPCEVFKTWINDKLYPDITVHNFTSDWCSGRTLGALLDRISPGMCEEWELFKAANSLTNLQSAMGKAEKYLNATQLITPADLLSPDIDPLCVIIYLSQLLEVKVNPVSERGRIPLHHSQSVPDGQAVDNQNIGAQASDTQRVISADSGISHQHSRPSTYSSDYQSLGASSPLGSTWTLDEQYLHPGDYHYQRGPSVSLHILGARACYPRIQDKQSRQDYFQQKKNISDPSEDRRMGIQQPEDHRSRTLGDAEYYLEQIRFREPVDPEEFWNLMERMHVPYNRELRKYVKTGELVLSKEPLGIGHYGTVHKGRFADPDKGYQIVAAKSFSVEGTTLKTVKNFLNEVNIMRNFQHVNVLHVLAFTFRGGLPYILLPLHENKDLHTFLHKTDRNTSRKYLHQFAEDIACGMEYITALGFVHRDLAARNCLVDDEMHIQVADFGFTRDVFASDYVMTATQQELPLRWMALELVLGHKVFKTATDVWAYGVVLWEIYSFGDRPYSNVINDEDIGIYLQHGNRLEKPVATSEQMYRLMVRCWNEDYTKRPNFGEILDTLKDMNQVSPQQ